MRRHSGGLARVPLPSGLPIDTALPALIAALANHRSAVLQAPPGAGKSTVVPLALLSQPWMAGKRLLMLEPRRLAARAVAHRMAQTLRESVGSTVGYRMRMDTRVSRDTRIEVVTEGVLTRMLQSDAALEGVAAVIFDEFHERSLQVDLGLALCLDARANLTPELRVVIMSATLDGQAVARLLDEAPVVTAEGRVLPVETRFVGKGAPLLPPLTPSQVSGDSPEKAVALIVQRALREEHGDILVFLPGAREIRRVQGLLQAANLDRSVCVLPLYGDLSVEAQEAALTAPAPGDRKVVLATNIAETSVTIPGVRIIVDSGLVRRSVFDPATGMSRLETQRISRASAEQRQGRAGRVEPGVCYRLWSEEAQRSLAPFTLPEIADVDLAPLALELAHWGVRDAGTLRWLDEPPAAMLASARDLLRSLGALADGDRISAHGRQLAGLGIHPRLAHMLVRAAGLGWLPLACDLAALLSERDLLRGAPGASDMDIRSRLDLIRGDRSAALSDPAILQRVRRASRELARQVESRVTASRAPSPHESPVLQPSQSLQGAAGVLLAFAYPDRIGRRRQGTEPRYMLSNGRGAHFASAQALGREEFIVAVDLDDRERDARILLAAPLARAEIDEYLAERLVREQTVDWDSREQAVLARRIVRLGCIVVEEKPGIDVPPEQSRRAMIEGIRGLGIESLPWTREARDLQARMMFVRGLAASTDWPDVSDPALAASLDEWLSPWLEGITRRDHLARLSLPTILKSRLTWERQRELDRLAPTRLQLPSGSNIRIDYLDDSAPVVSVRLQEVFGLQETPRIGAGRVPITFKLLSPAQRPVQVTRDLGGFWRGSYADVRKDLRGRYPKHYWPTLEELDDIQRK